MNIKSTQILARKVKYYFLCSSFLILFNSSNVLSKEISNNLIKEGTEIITDKRLLGFINKYYSSELKGDWRETYNMRSLEYRDAINYTDYSKEMTDGAIGWRLVNISIIALAMNNNDYEIIIKFDEKIDDDVKYRKLINAYIRDDELMEEVEFDSDTNIFSYTEKTVWRAEHTNWIAIEPGTRQHLYMNSKVISED